MLSRARLPGRRADDGHAIARFNLLHRVLPYTLYLLINLAFCRSALGAALGIATMIPVVACLMQVRARVTTIEDLLVFISFIMFAVRPVQAMVGLQFAAETASPVGSAPYSVPFFVAASAGGWLLLGTLLVFMMRRDPGERVVTRYALSARAAPLLVGLNAGLLLLYVAWNGGLANTLRPRFEKVIVTDAPWISIVYGAQMATTALAAALAVQRRSAGTIVAVLACLALQLVSANPFNTSRFALISAYLPVVLIGLRGRIPVTMFLAAAGLFLIVAMPILSVTTRGGDAQRYETAAGPLLLPYNDIYDMSVENVAYTGRKGFTWGAKLAGDVLFFVPRSLWPGKPTLNGLDVGGELVAGRLAGTDNLSMPLISDGYRDAGLLGSLAAAILLIGLIDLAVVRRVVYVNGARVLHHIVFAALPIVLRGPFSAVAPLVVFEWLTCLLLVRLLARPAPAPSPPRTFRTVASA